MSALESGRAVVTGMAAIAPNGRDMEAYWEATLKGRSGIGRIKRFDATPYLVRLAGEVSDLDFAEHIGPRLVVQTDRWTQLSLLATERALADAAFDPREQPEYSMSVVTASASGGNELGQREIERLWSKGPRYVGPYQSIAWFYAATTGQISIKHGMKGPCGVVVSEQAGGLDAVGQARRVLRRGARMVVTGGTEAPLCPYGLTCQIASGLLSRSEDPAHAYLPFDALASGYVPGEGGAILILEDGEAARSRGVDRVHGEIAGYAATFDPRPSAGREPGLRRAAELALDDARVAPGEIDLVLADAAGVPALDRSEADAITGIFGPRGVPVTAPKTMTGRLYAGGASLDLVTALLSLRDSVIPPTVGVGALAPGCELDLVCGEPREARLGNVLVLARGFGGFNAAVVVKSADGFDSERRATCRR